MKKWKVQLPKWFSKLHCQGHTQLTPHHHKIEYQTFQAWRHCNQSRWAHSKSQCTKSDSQSGNYFKNYRTYSGHTSVNHQAILGCEAMLQSLLVSFHSLNILFHEELNCALPIIYLGEDWIKLHPSVRCFVPQALQQPSCSMQPCYYIPHASKERYWTIRPNQG